MKNHRDFGGLERALKKINGHHNIYHVVYDLGIPTFKPREFVMSQIWKWTEEDVLTSVGSDVADPEFPLRSEYLRSSSAVLMTYTKQRSIGEGVLTPQTKVSYTQQVDLGGSVPKWVQNSKAVDTLMYAPPPTLLPSSPFSNRDPPGISVGCASASTRACRSMRPSV